MIGQTVGKYELLAEIGRGSMGVVYKARDIYLRRFAALKLIGETALENREAVLRFEREGRAASALMHPNICTVFDTGNWLGRPYLAMEFLEGVALSERMRAGPLALPQVLSVAIPVLGALEAAHRAGIVHRDIKPANLFLTNRGVKVLDFGLAKIRHSFEAPAAAAVEDLPTMATFVTTPGTVLGTLAYMSPEQMLGDAVDGRADLYSLGAVIYEMSTGRLPVIGSAIRGLPPELASVVAKMLAPRRNARYSDAAEARAALAALVV